MECLFDNQDSGMKHAETITEFLNAVSTLLWEVLMFICCGQLRGIGNRSHTLLHLSKY